MDKDYYFKLTLTYRHKEMLKTVRKVTFKAWLSQYRLWSTSGDVQKRIWRSWKTWRENIGWEQKRQNLQITFGQGLSQNLNVRFKRKYCKSAAEYAFNFTTDDVPLKDYCATGLPVGVTSAKNR